MRDTYQRQPARERKRELLKEIRLRRG